MHEALYHAEFGYYTANIREFGRRGDFTTWPALNEGLGRAIAQWALENRPAPGAGISSRLARDRELGRVDNEGDRLVEPAPLSHRRNFTAPETNPATTPGIDAIWHASVPEALGRSGGRALILSNELVDAFPCRVFKKDPGRLARTRPCASSGGRIVEEWRGPARFPTRPCFRIPGRTVSGVEVQECFQAWLRRMVARMEGRQHAHYRLW